ncbi:PH domain-containing protein [Homoserinibacter sp. YIM 151385]|uniref:PH domain-containing protein n=1 Tax=Homoserinibacter sp. YIM 151385 TaxID=2985506 RepID=UPI0022F032CF|nr:PH domain-containing protein [Homoserinibacter sp. YIM 151385]WBU36796.1 PH domain-containing protein [Homoserinibacter sp. YIM 151385]
MSLDDPAPPRPREVVVARLHPHGRALFWPSVLLVAVLGGAGWALGALAEDWQRIAVLGAAALLVVLGVLGPLLRWLSTSATITSRRVVLRHGILVRTRQELLHSRGYDVTVRRRGLQGLFGSGDVLVNSGLEQPIRLRDVPSAILVQASLSELMEAASTTVSGRRQQEQARRATGDLGPR